MSRFPSKRRARFSVKLPAKVAQRELAGDKIILPEYILTKLVSPLRQLPTPTLFEIKAVETKKILHCGVLEFSASEKTAFIPEWMYDSLGLAQSKVPDVRLTLKDLDKLTAVKFRPKTSRFVKLADPKSTLQHCLEQFATLTLDSTITIRYAGNEFTLTVTEIEPKVGKVPAGCVINATVTVDFEEPEEEDSEAPAEVLPSSVAFRGYVKQDEFKYYKFRLSDPTFMLTISVLSEEGNADLYISKTTGKPSLENCTWKSNTASSTNEVRIRPSDANFSKTWYFISVHGFESDASFSIIAVEEFEEDNQSSSGPSGRQLRAKSGTSSAKDSDNPNLRKCENCWRHIPKASFGMHTMQCERRNWRCADCGDVMDRSKKNSHAHCPVCQDVMPPDAISKHLKVTHDRIVCECGEAFEPSKIKAHRDNECSLRQVPCKFCELLLPFNKRGAHERYCGSRTSECPMCGKVVPDKQLQIHLAAFHDVNPCAPSGQPKAKRASALDTLGPDGDLAKALAASRADFQKKQVAQARASSLTQPSTSSAFSSGAPSAFGGPEPTASAFGSPEPASAFGGPEPASAFGGPEPTSAFGGPEPASAFGGGSASAFGGEPASAFGSAEPAASAFGGSEPAASAFGGPAPTASAFGGPAPTASAFGGDEVKEPASAFGAPPTSAFESSSAFNASMDTSQARKDSGSGGGSGVVPVSAIISTDDFDAANSGGDDDDDDDWDNAEYASDDDDDDDDGFSDDGAFSDEEPATTSSAFGSGGSGNRLGGGGGRRLGNGRSNGTSGPAAAASNGGGAKFHGFPCPMCQKKIPITENLNDHIASCG